MARKKEPKKEKHLCYECGQLIMGGVVGEDLHFIKNLGTTRWYCDKCMKKLLRGE